MKKENKTSNLIGNILLAALGCIFVGGIAYGLQRASAELDGYQGADLQELAKPVMAAMKLAGVDAVTCDGLSSVFLTIKGERYPVTREDIDNVEPMTCPTFDKLVISRDSLSKIIPKDFSSTKSAEDRLKSSPKEMVKAQFDTIATGITLLRPRIADFLKSKKQVNTEVVVYENRVKASWAK